MSLEDKIGALIAADEKNTELQEAVLATINAAKAGGAAAATAQAETKAAVPAEEKPKSTRAPRAAKAKVPTVKEIQDKTTGFLDVEDDTEYEERAATVVQINEHFGVKKMSEIGDEDRAKAMEMLDAAIAGDDPFEGVEAKEEAKPARRSLA